MNNLILLQDIAITHGVNTKISNGRLYYMDAACNWVDVTDFTLKQIANWLEQH